MCQGVQIWIRDNELNGYERQITLEHPTNLSTVILDKAMLLYQKNHNNKPIRSIGVRARKLSFASDVRQLSFLPEIDRMNKLENLEKAIDDIRNRFGRFSIQRGLMLKDKELTAFDPVNDHIIYPIAFRNS